MSDYVSIVKADNPWGLWMCEDVVPGSGFMNLADSSGNGRNTGGGGYAIANMSNPATLLTGRARALARSGGACPLTAGQPQTGAGAWTLEAWIKASSFASGNHFVVGFGTNAAHQTAILGFSTNFAFVGVNSDNSAFSASALSTSTVYYIVGNFDGTTHRLYINAGTPTTATPASVNMPVSGSFQIFNAPANVAGTEIACTLQGVAIYSAALTAAQIQTHYNAGLGIFPSSRKVYAVGSLPLVGTRVGADTRGVN